MSGSRRLNYSVANQAKIIDWTTVTPVLCNFAAATGAAVSVASDGAARCSFTSSGTGGQYTGLRYEHPTATWDLSEYWREGGWFGIDCGFPPGVTTDGCTGAYVQVLFCNEAGATFTNYARTAAMANFTKQRRMCLFNARSMYTTGAGTFNPAAVKRIEIRFVNALANHPFPAIMDVYGFWAGVKSRPKVMLGLDDEFESAYNELYLGNTGAGMIDYGWKGSLYLSTNNMNLAGRMTTAQVQTLVNAGWMVGPHGDTHDPLTYTLSITSSGTTATAIAAAGGVSHGKSVGETITIKGAFYPEYNGTFTIATVPAADRFTYTMAGTPLSTSAGAQPYMVEWQSDTWRRARIQGAIDWMNANLTGHSTKHMAYVNGAYDDNVVSIVQSMGFKTARTTNSSGWPSYGINSQMGTTDFFRLPCIDMTNGATAASILALVDTCIRYGSSCIIYGHQFVTTPASSTEFSIAEKTTLLQGLRRRELEGLCDVGMTIAEWQDGLG